MSKFERIMYANQDCLKLVLYGSNGDEYTLAVPSVESQPITGFVCFIINIKHKPEELMAVKLYEKEDGQ